MTGPDLKPCPFCGGNNIRAFRHVPMQPDPCVMCRDCYASAVSIAAWNTRDPATLAALPEVQALIAANYRRLVAEITGNPSGTKCDACRACGHYHCADAFYGCAGMRDYTLEEATAALARIEREAEARGRGKGLREAAEIVTEVQRQEMSDTEGVMPPDRFDEGTSAAYETILARADQIEKDAK